MKILIVDDELVSRTKLKLIMENFGECEAVKHGKDAIALFHYGHHINEPFNLIMLDINLPELDGIMVLSEIRRAEKYLNIPKAHLSKILMVTSYGDKDRIVACVQSGCDEYIVKPFDSDVINQKLAKLGIIELEPISDSEKSDSNSPFPTGTSQLVEEIYSFLGGREISLPSLPGIQAKFRKMIATGAVFQQISNLLKKDLAISVELIRMSNSAYYKGVKKNKSLEQAIARLGYAATEQVVSEMTGRKFITMKNKKYRIMVESLWKHSLACAYTSEITTNLLHLNLSADSFSLGLLHDIGKLALLQIIANIEQRSRSKEEISTGKLVKTIRDHHCVFGAKILEKWKYAQSFVHSALHHDSPELEEENISTELLIVNFANLLAKSLGYDLNTEHPADIDLENAESALRLKITPSQITKTKEKVIEEMNAALELF
jgi:HD-like signal output (HDOD) protein/ActR/RegA family two-component response regulator